MSTTAPLSPLLPAHVSAAIMAGADPGMLCTPDVMRTYYALDTADPVAWEDCFPQLVNGHPFTPRHALAVRAEANVYGDLLAMRLLHDDPEGSERLRADLPAEHRHLADDVTFVVVLRHAVHTIAVLITQGFVPTPASALEGLALRAVLNAATDAHLLDLVDEDVEQLARHDADNAPDGGMGELAAHLLAGYDLDALTGPWVTWLASAT